MSDKQHIIDLENRFWQTMIDRDADAGAALISAKSIVAGAQGAATIDRPAFKQMMDQGEWTLENYVFSDVQVEFPTPDVAVIAYKVTENLVVEGKALKMEAADASTWVRKGGEWTCALHTESVLGDPYGRDRVAGKQG